MRRLYAVLVLGCVLGLSALPAAVAASPNVNHFSDSGTDTDKDFCGTGKTVEIAFAFHGTEFLAPQNADFRQTIEGNNVFTNPLNGNVVVAHFADNFSDTIVSGDPEGLHVHEFTFKGLPELLRTKGGGVLSRDAGYITFHVLFDGDEFISNEIVVNRGPHPEAESDFELFCSVMTEALGL